MRRVGELAALRLERREARRAEGAATMVAQDAKASGALVIEAERISKGYDGRADRRDFSIRVMRGDRIGVVGANGAGKTTLVNLCSPARSPPIRARCGSAPMSRWPVSTSGARRWSRRRRWSTR